jgi:UDP-N-acetyl-D-glucosamine dehydrogenase
VPELPRMRRYSITLTSTPLTEEAVSSFDAVVLTTDHSNLPYEMIHRCARLIVDSRNGFRKRGLRGPHVVLA